MICDIIFDLLLIIEVVITEHDAILFFFENDPESALELVKSGIDKNRRVQTFEMARWNINWDNLSIFFD